MLSNQFPVSDCGVVDSLVWSWILVLLNLTNENIYKKRRENENDFDDTHVMFYPSSFVPRLLIRRPLWNENPSNEYNNSSSRIMAWRQCFEIDYVGQWRLLYKFYIKIWLKPKPLAIWEFQFQFRFLFVSFRILRFMTRCNKQSSWKVPFSNWNMYFLFEWHLPSPNYFRRWEAICTACHVNVLILTHRNGRWCRFEIENVGRDYIAITKTDKKQKIWENYILEEEKNEVIIQIYWNQKIKWNKTWHKCYQKIK